MSDAHTKVNLKTDVEDQAAAYDLAPNFELRFGRGPLGCEQHGVSYVRVGPGFRVPFGHRHAEQEEVYVLISGGAQIKIEGQTLEMTVLDAVRVSASAVRSLQGGPEGAELIVTGAPAVDNDGELLPGWWTD